MLLWRLNDEAHGLSGGRADGEEGLLDLGLPKTPPLPLPICPLFIPALAGGGSSAGVILD